MDTDQFWLDELLAAHGDDAGNLTCGTIHPRDPDAPGTGHEEAHQAVVVSDLAHSQAPQAILKGTSPSTNPPPPQLRHLPGVGTSQSVFSD
jgi:hypothetical protein